MSQVSSSKVYINFECPDCNTNKRTDVHDAIYNGAPCCPMCEEEMDIVDCEIDDMVTVY
jgi:transcription elongation factor Elf1